MKIYGPKYLENPCDYGGCESTNYPHIFCKGVESPGSSGAKECGELIWTCGILCIRRRIGQKMRVIYATLLRSAKAALCCICIQSRPVPALLLSELQTLRFSGSVGLAAVCLVVSLPAKRLPTGGPAGPLATGQGLAQQGRGIQ